MKIQNTKPKFPGLGSAEGGPNKAQNMDKAQNTNKYRDLEERTYRFAERCREFVKKLPRTVPNSEYSKQLIRSSGSQAANYIEANESLSRKDFVTGLEFAARKLKRAACGCVCARWAAALFSKQNVGS